MCSIIHLSALAFLIFAAEVASSDCLLTLNAPLSVASGLLGTAFCVCVCQNGVWTVVKMCPLLSAAGKKKKEQPDNQAYRSTFGLDVAVVNIDLR